MALQKLYELINWENKPSDKTPVNEQNMKKIDVALYGIDDRVIRLDATKLDKVDAQGLIEDITLDMQTGIFKKYYYNGATEEINTGISKLNMNLRFDKGSQILYIVNADGTEDPVDLSVFMTNYEFQNSETIAHNVSADGTVTSIVKKGSIEEKHLQPNYLADIKVEVAKAEASATAASASEINAKASENAAKSSENAAATSESNAATSAGNAEENALAAAQSADDASGFAGAAASYKDDALASSNKAQNMANAASTYATNSINSATSASTSASTATTKASEASNYATEAESYARGGTGTRENENVDNAKYYYEQLYNASQGLNGLIPKGNITFEELADEENQQPGYFFNVSDSFVSDERFKDGSGIFYGAGSNVLYTADGMWDVTAASMVSGVKGDKEMEYRQGFVNITPANIGALPENTKFMPMEHYGTTSINATGYIKIKILSTIQWMLSFTLRLYQGYNATDLLISGYQYGNNYWYKPSAVILGDSRNLSVAVSFGYDSVNNLWVAVPANSYTGATVFGINNGYSQADDWENKISIIREETLTGTVQTTVTAYPPLMSNAGIRDIQKATALPSDAASHTTTLYVILQ